jgi:Domain of unknown function (DUF4387)
MPKLSEVCSYVRSKNAGPFWITIDLTFPDQASFARYASGVALQPEAIGALFGVDVALSYPRRRPQGGVLERDMHGGQQYIRLLDVEMDEGLSI